MKNFSLLLISLGLLLISCQDEEKPEEAYGTYQVESIVSDQALDISGEGLPTTDLISQFEAVKISKNSIFISLNSPEEYNVGFSQIVFAIPFQDIEDPKLGLGNGSFGRRADIADDGYISLSWSLAPDFDQPYQLHQNIIVDDIQIGNISDRRMEVVLTQTFFDQLQREWVAAKVTYTLLKEDY